MKNSSEWNSDLQRNRKSERPNFFEHQTKVIHYPKKAKNASVTTDFGSYPVAVVPGQYQYYYQKYSAKELFRLPINTVLDAEIYRPLKRCHSPEPIVVTQSDLQKGSNKPNKDTTPKSIRRNSKSSASASMDRCSLDMKYDLNESCAFCCEDIKSDEKYVQCSKCRSCGHPHCMEMSEEMLAVTKSYPWMCMECKPCSICSKLDGEDQMMFCDRCDRGYHTYCVGLAELPSGHWVCPKFCRQRVTEQNTSQLPLNFSCLTPAPPSDGKVIDQTIRFVDNGFESSTVGSKRHRNQKL